VANPFYGHGGTGVIGGPTVALAQLLLPYPQFSTINLQNTYSWASYNSIFVKAQKRLGQGILFIGTDTWSRNMGASLAELNSPSGAGTRGPQNIYNLAAEYARAADDTPSRFVASVSYELPFGRGRAFVNSNRWLDLAVGGWQLNAITTYQTGFPL